MTLLATLFPDYESMDFDLECAVETPLRLVITFEQAVEWANAELREGRDDSIKWEYEEYDDGVLQGGNRVGRWTTECNEDGTSEEWLLFVRDVPFWKP